MTRRAVARPAVSAEELRWIVDRLPSGIVVLDDELKVRYRNVAARRIFHPAHLVPGEPLPEIGCDPPVRRSAMQLLEIGRLIKHELRLPGGGRTFLVDGIRSHSAHSAVLQIEDTTVRTRRQRAGEDFVVNAAHEFLSPLTAIAGAAHVLQEGAEEPPEIRERFLRHILTATARLISISRALLVLARAEAGMEPPRLDLVPLRPLLDEAVAGTSREIEVSCSDDAAVLAEPDLLGQAVSNLVDNARRHSTGAIAVAVAEVGNRTVRIEVADRGGGILPEHVDRVTERFFRVGGHDATGYGVGLSIAARSVEALGGTLTMRSDRTGTTARIEVPSARVEA